MKPFLFLLLLATTCFAPYLSSWSGLSITSLGGLVRDLVLLISVGMSLRVMQISSTSRLFLMFWVFLILYFIGYIALGVNIKAEIVGGKAILGAIAYTIVAAGWARSPLSQSAVVGILIIGMICALLGIADVATDGGALDLIGYRDDYGGSSERFLMKTHYGANLVRASGGLGDALNYGYVMGFFTLYLLVNSTQIQSSKTSALYLTCAAICALATILSVTRGAVFGMILGALIIFGRRLKSVVLLLPLLVAAVGAVVINITEVQDIVVMRMVQPDELSQESSQLRIDMFQEALVLVREHPWGFGLGSQGASITLYGRLPYITDNTYMIFILEAGLVGGALIMGVVITGLLVLVEADKGGSLLTVLAFGLYWSISAGLSGAFTSSMPSGVFWLLLATSVGLKNQGYLNHKPANGVREAWL